MSSYYVSTNGTDSAERDGLSWETAWRLLSYASDRVPAGDHIIQMGSGKFVASQTAYPDDGVTIAKREVVVKMQRRSLRLLAGH